MYKITAISCIIIASSGLAFADDQNIRVYDRDYNHQSTIKQRGEQYDIYDKSYNRKGYIRGDKIYNNKWERQGSVEEGGDRGQKQK